MHRKAEIWVVGLLAAAFAIGCGSAPSGTTAISFKSPAVDANGEIRGNVNCGWGSLWLPLEWGPVPPGTEELAIYIGLFRHETINGARKLVVSFGEIISNLDPALRRNRVNTLPNGAAPSYVGRSCPPVRSGQRVLQEIFALDRVERYRPMNMRLARRLTEEALRSEGIDPDSRSAGPLTEDAVGIGRFIAIYGPTVQ